MGLTAELNQTTSNGAQEASPLVDAFAALAMPALRVLSHSVVSTALDVQKLDLKNEMFSSSLRELSIPPQTNTTLSSEPEVNLANASFSGQAWLRQIQAAESLNSAA